MLSPILSRLSIAHLRQISYRNVFVYSAKSLDSHSTVDSSYSTCDGRTACQYYLSRNRSLSCVNTLSDCQREFCIGDNDSLIVSLGDSANIGVLVFLLITKLLSCLLTKAVVCLVSVVVTVLAAFAVVVIITGADGFLIKHEQALLTSLGDLLGRKSGTLTGPTALLAGERAVVGFEGASFIMATSRGYTDLAS